MDSILVQKKVRDNSEDLRTYLKDLALWEDEMKRKESDLTTEDAEASVPIPHKSKKVQNIKSTKNKTVKPTKIKSYDYAAWDKFDVDAECDKIDKEESNGESSEEEEAPSEEYKNRLREEANYEKEKGNQFVKNQKWDEAIICYTHSIACYNKDPIFYANRAHCYIKKNDLHSAEADCTSALQLEPKYVKALQRRAFAREGLKQLKEATEDLENILKLEPHNKDARQQLGKIEKKLGIVKKKVDIAIPSTSKQEHVKVETKTVKEPKKQHKSNEKSEIKQSTLEPKIVKESEPKKKLKSTAHSKTTEELDKHISAKTSKQTLIKQMPWPERKSSEIFLPVHKPPHQRSKQPLKRIEIVESDSSDIIISTQIHPSQIVKESTDYNETNVLAKIIAESNQINVENILNNIENEEISKEIKQKNIKAEKIIECKTSEFTDVISLPVPKSSVQFYSHWKTMKNCGKSKYLYLKKINPKDIPNIFKDSLESDVLGGIILILSEYFIQDKLPVYEYIYCLSKVKRFSAITLFLSSADKEAVKKLIEYCKNTKEATENDLQLLVTKYEL